MAHVPVYNQIFSSCDPKSAQNLCETAFRNKKLYFSLICRYKRPWLNTFKEPESMLLPVHRLSPWCCYCAGLQFPRWKLPHSTQHTTSWTGQWLRHIYRKKQTPHGCCGNSVAGEKWLKFHINIGGNQCLKTWEVLRFFFKEESSFKKIFRCSLT